jgi:hypothetical protein
VIAASLMVAAWAPAADAAFVSKVPARAYLLRAVPPVAPGVMLGDARAKFFRTGRFWVQRAEGCHRHSDVEVSCRFVARLVPDAAHREQNWWPIECRGTLLVGLNDDGRMQGDQGDYTCRTIRR